MLVYIIPLRKRGKTINGMLSGDAEAIVDDWEVEVRTVSEESIDGETENEETQ